VPRTRDCTTDSSGTQEIGLLAQGVYEFHQVVSVELRGWGTSQVSRVLGLENRGDEVHDRVTQILLNYHANPILLGKEILKLIKGDEGFLSRS